MSYIGSVSADPIELCVFDYSDHIHGTKPLSILAWRQDDRFTGYAHVQGTADGLGFTEHRGRPTREVIEEMYLGGSNYVWQSPPLLPGEFHPRIWRNGIADHWLRYQRPKKVRAYTPDFAELRSRCISFRLIQQHLARVFEVVTPDSRHDDASGAAMRQILLLSAIEVEGLLKGVYIANHAVAPNSMNIHSYARLAAPMRLSEWAAEFEYFPDAGVSYPFRGWAPGQSPAWWTANNMLKHDPLHPIRYRDVLDCSLSVRILIEAQFGPYCQKLLPGAGLAKIAISKRPSWIATEKYYPPTEDHTLGASRPKCLF